MRESKTRTPQGESNQTLADAYTATNAAYTLAQTLAGEVLSDVDSAQRLRFINAAEAYQLNAIWLDFAKDFQFSPRYYLAGQTMRVKPERVAQSPYRDELTFAARIGIHTTTFLSTHALGL